MNQLVSLFLTFAKVGVLTFGGGYAMLPILQREVVESKHWANEEELMDYYAVGQCTPGVIAVNTATFIGRKQAGILGGVVATLGVVFPSVLIISLLSEVISRFAQVPTVQHAFSGIRVCVCVLIFNAVYKLVKKSVKNLFSAVVFAFVLLLSVFGVVSSPILVVIAGFAGVAYHSVKKEAAK